MAGNVSWSAFLIYLKIMRSHKWASPLRHGICFKKKYLRLTNRLNESNNKLACSHDVCANDTILIVVTNNSETTTDESLQALLATSTSTPIYIP